jgi:hypothetical protein
MLGPRHSSSVSPGRLSLRAGADGVLRWFLLVSLWACTPVDSSDIFEFDPIPRTADGSFTVKDFGPISLLDVGPTPDQGPRFPGPGIIWNQRVLFVDLESRSGASWSGLREDLTRRGVEFVHRKHYPHVTDADVQGDYGAIIVAMGTGPGGPVPMMRAGSVNALSSFVGRGGTLMFLTSGGWENGSKSTNDRYRINQILENVEVRARVENNTLVGDVFLGEGDRPPLHVSRPWAYVTPLEWNLAGAVGFVGPGLQTDPPITAFALGDAPSISCESANIRVLARAHIDIYSWVALGGDMPLEIPNESLPVAIISTALAGQVAIAPRSFFELPFHSAQGADQPILEPNLLDGTRAIANLIVSEWLEAADGQPVAVHEGCIAGHLPLFRLGEDIESDGELRPPPTGMSTRDVAARSPIPPEWAQEGIPNGPVEPLRPSWFPPDRARLVYGDLWAVDRMRPIINQLQITGMNGFVATMPAGPLINFDPTANITALISETAQLSLTAQQKFFVATHFRNEFYGELRSEVSPALGAHGQTLDAPRPLSDIWWRQNLEPLVLGAARASAEITGLTGMVLDLELYEAGSLAYADGHCFDDECWAHIAESITANDTDRGHAASIIQTTDRLPWLVDQGLMAFAYRHLENLVAARGRDLLERAREIDPDFTLILYTHAVQDGWFYRGLYRGFGTTERPVVLLSYDQNLDYIMRNLRARGYPVFGLSGILGVRLSARDAGTALYNAAANSDGYWLFQYGDFEITENDPGHVRNHDDPSEYWQQFSRTNTRLDALAQPQ